MTDSAPAITAMLRCTGIACLLCAALLLLLLKSGWAWRIAIDTPNHRSLHALPTPRVGGWGILFAVLIVICATQPEMWRIAGLVLFIGVLSQIDDRRGLPVSWRFIAHFFAALGLVGAYPCATAWQAAATIFCVVWAINLYNFMDGADGLAGGMAVFGFSAYAFAGFDAAPQLALASSAVAGAALGFLFFNFSPARLFLGDAGSIPLGFLAAAFGYLGWQAHVWPLWFAPMVFSPFIMDASITLLRRIAQRKRFWEAHREHYYQRMIRMGETHRQVTLQWYGLMLAACLVAICLMRLDTVVQWEGVVAWLVFLCFLGWRIDCRWLVFMLSKSRFEA